MCKKKKNNLHGTRAILCPIPCLLLLKYDDGNSLLFSPRICYIMRLREYEEEEEEKILLIVQFVHKLHTAVHNSRLFRSSLAQEKARKTSVIGSSFMPFFIVIWLSVWLDRG